MRPSSQRAIAEDKAIRASFVPPRTGSHFGKGKGKETKRRCREEGPPQPAGMFRLALGWERQNPSLRLQLESAWDGAGPGRRKVASLLRSWGKVSTGKKPNIHGTESPAGPSKLARTGRWMGKPMHQGWINLPCAGVDCCPQAGCARLQGLCHSQLRAARCLWKPCELRLRMSPGDTPSCFYVGPSVLLACFQFGGRTSLTLRVKFLD